MRIEFPLTDEEAQILGHLYVMLDVDSAKALIFKIPELLQRIEGEKTGKKLAATQAKWHAIYATDETAQFLAPRE